MHLFKRLLLTKFPNSTIQNMVNPASMFVGFISSREFFSIINRKIIENYKLNLFDVNLDVVEFKMGFWEYGNTDKQKDIETYFAYCVAANLNGYHFYSPANLSNGITLLSSLYFADTLRGYPHHYFTQLLYTVFLLSFTFASRVKVFPSEQENENYNWFIEVFFDFYKITFQQLDTKISKSDFDAVKKELLKETSFFFLLFHFYKRLNTLFAGKGEESEFLERILQDRKWEKILKAFKQNYATTKYLPHSSPLEQSVLTYIWPADILVKYLIGNSDPFLVVEAIVSKIFNKSELDSLVQSFLKSEENLPRLLDYLLTYKKYKHWFFAWVQNYIIKLFRSEGREDLLEDIDEMLSAIDNGDDISSFDVPERIKRESKVTERLLNFYITLLGGFTNARGDSFYTRIQKPDLISLFVSKEMLNVESNPAQLEYLGHILYIYGKNLYYYHYINDKVRSGKNKFSIPIKGSDEKIVADFYAGILYLEGMTSAYFQDINPKDTRLNITNTQILDDFKQKFGTKISALVKESNSDFLSHFYAPLFAQSSSAKELFADFVNLFDEKAISNLKDALYKIEFWLNKSFLEKIELLKLENYYSQSVLLAIFGTARETLFGMLLLMTYLNQHKDKMEQDQVDCLWIFYIRDILGLKIKEADQIYLDLLAVYEEFQDFLKIWVELDDNSDFFKFIAKNTQKFFGKKDKSEIIRSFSAEDVLWFRGLLKNISYYNQRYIIPK